MISNDEFYARATEKAREVGQFALTVTGYDTTQFLEFFDSEEGRALVYAGIAGAVLLFNELLGVGPTEGNL